MKRRLARKKAIQALFQIDVSGTDTQDAKDFVLDGEDGSDPFFHRLVDETVANLTAIDQTIKKHLEHWRFDRIGKVDRAILRMAVYELRYEEEIPTSVTMNEAVELAKVFGGDESSRFVNGVLSKVLEGEQ